MCGIANCMTIGWRTDMVKKLACLLFACAAATCCGCKLVDFVDRGAVASWLETVVNDSGLCNYVCSMCHDTTEE